MHVFQGKKDLLESPSFAFAGLRKMAAADSCIVVLVDRDRDNCLRLKSEAGEDGVGCRLGDEDQPRPHE